MKPHFLLLLALLLLAPSLHAQTAVAVSPALAQRGQTVSLSITGSGIDFLSTTCMGVEFRPLMGGAFSSSIAGPVSASVMTTQVTIPANAPLGDYQLRLIPFTPWSSFLFTVLPATGSSFGIVSGKTFIDSDADCIADAGESPVPTMLEFQPNGGVFYTNSQGEYNATLPLGTYNVQAYSLPHLAPTCAPSFQVTLSTNGQHLTGQDIAMDKDSVADMSIFCNLSESRPGFSQIHDVQIFNLGAMVHNGTVTWIADPNYDIQSASNGGLISGDTVRWTYSQMAPGGQMLYQVTTYVPLSVTLGTQLTCSAYVDLDQADFVPVNNDCLSQIVVVGSYDPNDKMVWNANMQSADPSISAQDSILTYRIRFQNTGTASAINISIRDTLDLNLDIRTLRTIATSHPNYEFVVDDLRNMEWRFPNINLIDSLTNEPESHGYVVYQVKIKQPFGLGMYIRNQAHIYFDFNPPVATNITQSSIPTAVPPPTGEQFFSVFPNPANEALQIRAQEQQAGKCAYVLIDLQGRTLMEGSLASGQGELSTKGLPIGVYLLRLQSGKHAATHKVLIAR